MTDDKVAEKLLSNGLFFGEHKSLDPSPGV